MKISRFLPHSYNYIDIITAAPSPVLQTEPPPLTITNDHSLALGTTLPAILAIMLLLYRALIT